MYWGGTVKESAAAMSVSEDGAGEGDSDEAPTSELPLHRFDKDVEDVLQAWVAVFEERFEFGAVTLVPGRGVEAREEFAMRFIGSPICADPCERFGRDL